MNSVDAIGVTSLIPHVAETFILKNNSIYIPGQEQHYDGLSWGKGIVVC